MNKKFLTLLAALLILITITGCSKKEDPAVAELKAQMQAMQAELEKARGDASSEEIAKLEIAEQEQQAKATTAPAAQSTQTVTDVPATKTSGNWAINNGHLTINNGVTSIGDATFDRGRFTSVTIPDSVTSIGGGAFVNCLDLTSVTIPDSVTSIGGGAFGNCPSLTSINIPSSVTSIENDAFGSCSSLTSVIIPNSVTSIGARAFGGCSSLTSVTIGSGVTSIDLTAFQGGCSSLTAINVDPANTAYSSENGIVYNKAKTTLVLYPEGKAGAFTIPSHVTSIGVRAFADCNRLTSVTIPASVTSIGNYAFSSRGLASVTFQGAITASRFGERAFPPAYGANHSSDFLRTAYLAGGIGTYIRTGMDEYGNDGRWTKQ